jgi:hypothetical protein
MLLSLVAVALAASPASTANAALRAVARGAEVAVYDVEAALWADLPAFGQAACDARQRGEPVDADPIARIADLPAPITDRLRREGTARNVMRLGAAGCRVVERPRRATRRSDAPDWLASVSSLTIVPVECTSAPEIVGLAVIARPGSPPQVADVVDATNRDGYLFISSLLHDPTHR